MNKITLRKNEKFSSKSGCYFFMYINNSFYMWYKCKIAAKIIHAVRILCSILNNRKHGHNAILSIIDSRDVSTWEKKIKSICFFLHFFTFSFPPISVNVSIFFIIVSKVMWVVNIATGFNVARILHLHSSE